MPAGEFTQPAGEGDLIVLHNVLVAEEQHLVVEEGGLNGGYGTVIGPGPG